MGWWHDFTSSQPWVEWINDRTLKPFSEIYVKIDPIQHFIKGSAWVMDKSIELVAKPLSKIAYKPIKDFEKFIHFTPPTGNFQSLDRWQRDTFKSMLQVHSPADVALAALAVVPGAKAFNGVKGIGKVRAVTTVAEVGIGGGLIKKGIDDFFDDPVVVDPVVVTDTNEIELDWGGVHEGPELTQDRTSGKDPQLVEIPPHIAEVRHAALQTTSRLQAAARVQAAARLPTLTPQLETGIAVVSLAAATYLILSSD
jgi:hypothetical protein